MIPTAGRALLHWKCEFARGIDHTASALSSALRAVSKCLTAEFNSLDKHPPAMQVAAENLDSIALGATEIPLAAGRGVSTPDSPLELQEPALLTLIAADGLPFEARLYSTNPEPEVDSRIVTPRPSGGTSLAWARDREVTLSLEAGEYDLLIHRGLRWEIYEQHLIAGEGSRPTIAFELTDAYSPEGTEH